MTLFEEFEPKPEFVPITLRKYQQEALEAVMAAMDKGIQRQLVVLPTGCGKTTVFSALLHALSEDDPSFTGLVLAHNYELLDQAQRRISTQVPGMRCQIHNGDSKVSDRSVSIVVGSVQTLGRPGSDALDWLCPKLTICDEAHHGAARTYQNVFNRFGCYTPDSGSYLLGVTATAHRLDNQSLYGTDRSIFEEVTYEMTLKEAITQGWLCNLVGFRVGANLNLDNVKKTAGDFNQDQLEEAINTEPINELAFNSWQEKAAGRRTIVFCTGISHANAIADLFNSQGVPAAAIHGELKKEAREKIVSDFRNGKLTVLTNCQIATEGFDVPEVACVVLLRPTLSWSLFTQMVGRGLRVLPGVVDNGISEDLFRRLAVEESAKPDCIVIDIVDNTATHTLGGTPEDGGVPSIAGLVGLPSTLDMEGASITEAIELFEDLPPEVQQGAWKRPVKLSGLSHVLTQIDMLAELERPEEAKYAALVWLKTKEFHYSCDCGPSGERKQRVADLHMDMLGKWHLELSVGENTMLFPIDAKEVREAFEQSEVVIRQMFSGAYQFAHKNAHWRKGEITDKQRSILLRYGVDESVIKQLDRGKANGMISRLINNQRGGR